jgi:CPA1 family monovalent cation:H+ antiporter
MDPLLVVVLLVAVVVSVNAVARRFGLLAPILMVIVGLALSYVPGFPIPEVSPQFLITAILPPLIYVAALETSVPAFKYNIRRSCCSPSATCSLSPAAVGLSSTR